MTNNLKHTYSIKDIEGFITNNTEESINLDFKRGDALRKGHDSKDAEKVKTDIAKDVSSFANSDGGIIVYGIEEKNHKADSIYFVNGNDFTKENLEQIINSRIQRKIDGLIIDPIRFDNKIEQTIYVVKIPRSLNAPHITSDKKFYKRYNFEAVAMEEYEVRNMYLRQERTELTISPLKIHGSAGAMQYHKFNYYNIKIEFSVENIGQSIEKLYKLEVKIPRQIATNSNKYGYQQFFKNYSREDGEYLIYIFPNSSPLFQNELFTVCSVDLEINKRHLEILRELPILTKLYYSSGIVDNSTILYEHVKGLTQTPLLPEDFND
jgi:hypothetical protein